MKNLLVVIFISLTAVKLTAQDIPLTNEVGKTTNRFYIDLVGKAASLKGDWGLFGGMRAGYKISKNVSVGLAGFGLIPNELGGSYINKKGRDTLHIGYAGVEAAYNYYLSNNIYLTGMMLVGAGRVDYANLSGNDYFFIMEPGAAFNYRINDWFGLALSADYRLAAGVNYSDFSDASLSGWSTDISFKFAF